MAKRNIKIRFFATTTVTQTLEVDTDMTDEELLASLKGESDSDVCTSLLQGGEVYDIDAGGLETIGKVVEANFDDSEFSEFEVVEE